MNQRVADINQIINGIYDGLAGREPNERTQALLDRYHAERDEAENSDWHGWECYCQRCCE